MAKKRTILPLAPFERILRESGTPRVSKDGVRVFVEFVEEIARDIGADINLIVSRNKKKTVTASDVVLVRDMRKRKSLL